MFLATTGLTEWWDTQDELLLLGAWCLRYERRSVWEHLAYRVMPSPWNDRARFYESSRYLDACGERMLVRLTDYLNSAHGVFWTIRYWRILIGPWLMSHLHAMFDRYVHLTEAFRRYPALHTRVLDPGSFRVPRDVAEDANWINQDWYNLQIFSQQLEAMGRRFPVQALGAGRDYGARLRTRGGGRRGLGDVTAWGYQLAGRIAQSLRGGSRTAVLCNMYCPTSWMWGLACRVQLRAIPTEVEWGRSFAESEAVFDERRNGLRAIPSSDEFERVFVSSLPQAFPSLYLEGYRDAKEAVLPSGGRMPDVIVSAIGWYEREPLKFLAAEASVRGCRLVAVQHGGGYGIGRSSAVERHETRLADSFFSWGWADGGACRNLPSPNISEFMRRCARRRDGQTTRTILFVATAGPRYLHRFYSTPVGSQWSKYVQRQLDFLAATPQVLRQHVVFRPYQVDYGDGGEQRIVERFPEIRWYRGRAIDRRLAQARVVVIDHAATTFLRTLAANIPTVLFWDPERWEPREDAAAYFDELRRVGILWDAPEGAAEKLAEVHDDPWAWWGSPIVQHTRERFAGRFALGRADWRRPWVRALEEELELSQRNGA